MKSRTASPENPGAKGVGADVITARDMAYVALSAALMAICAWITVPMTVPFTLQTFAVALVTMLLGWKRSLLSIFVYIALGAVGLPVFAGFGAGLGTLFGMTGGYIAGFLFMALASGLLMARFGDGFAALVLSSVAGLLLLYAFGTAWFMFVYAKSTGAIGLTAVLMTCVVPYVIPDIAKILAAAAVAKRLKGRIAKSK